MIIMHNVTIIHVAAASQRLSPSLAAQFALCKPRSLVLRERGPARAFEVRLHRAAKLCSLRSTGHRAHRRELGEHASQTWKARGAYCYGLVPASTLARMQNLVAKETWKCKTKAKYNGIPLMSTWFSGNPPWWQLSRVCAHRIVIVIGCYNSQWCFSTVCSSCSRLLVCS